jgi:putative methyltransferase (TIGR04325 family)
MPMAKAREKGEQRIRFTDKLEDGDGADLFIVSGALHYFEEPLYPLLRRFRRPPPHVIVNRSPFSRGAALYTVRDVHTHLVACKLHGRSQFIRGMQDLGYQLRETWPIFELQAWAPLFPECCDRHYWGFHFALPA